MNLTPERIASAMNEPPTRHLSRRRFLTGTAILAGGATLAFATRPSHAGAQSTPSAATPGASHGPMPVNPQVGVSATTTILNPGVVSWVHFGDLHITTADQQNYADFQTIITNTNRYLKNGVNFAYLPGDNANDGAASEYQLIKAATDQLQVPLYAVPGDHDLKTNLTSYHEYLEPVDYQSFSAGGYHFAFLNVMNGIDGDEQNWLTKDLAAAKAVGLKSVLFMHSYNAVSSLQEVIQGDGVILVDAGHTHYNAVANDGHTIYAAGRNTGQVTEGPVGFVLTNLDNGVVSWKFKPLGSWPFVMITSPSDKLLMISTSQAVKGTVSIRTKVWDDKGVAAATYQIDGGTANPLQRIGTTQMWSAAWDSTKVSNGDHRITVRVQGLGGNVATDEISVVVDQTGTYQVPNRSFGPSGNSIGVYADKGLLGTQSAGGAKGAPGAAGPGGKGGPGGHGPASVIGVNGNVVTVRYRDGTERSVLVTGSTQITKVVNGQVVRGSLNDLKAGETVDVRTAVTGSQATAVTASPAAEATPSASGAMPADQIRIHAADAP